jgi:hypothetical protein
MPTTQIQAALAEAPMAKEMTKATVQAIVPAMMTAIELFTGQSIIAAGLSFVCGV